MANEKTLCIIKPDVVRSKRQGALLQRILDADFEVLALRQTHLTRSVAEAFYGIHRDRPFFRDLVDFMTSGPVVVIALQAPNAVARYRDLLGATDPKQATAGTLRAEFGTSIDNNAAHGSDSVENGVRETNFFFPGCELD